METNQIPKTNANPWTPVTDVRTLKILGKLGEEAGELSTAANRCVIQGPHEAHPETGKVNLDWLRDEIADVWALAKIAVEHFGIDEQSIEDRAQAKIDYLLPWVNTGYVDGEGNAV